MAQNTSATVAGFVTDASGAKIPSATVTYTNMATGVFAKCDDQRDWVIPDHGSASRPLQGDGHNDRVQDGGSAGHRPAPRRSGVDRLCAGTSVRHRKRWTVESGQALIETQSPTVSQVIEGRQVLDTPLNGRNSMNLVALTPGVVPQGGTSGGTSNNIKGGSFTNFFGYNNYQIAGGIAGHSSVYIDGAPTNTSLGHPLAFVLAQDDVQEFRVESSVVNPQYGEFGGGIVSFASKSGTSKLHGSIYEYLRNNIFNANTFFNNNTIVNGAPVPRPEFTQNQFGTTVGGAIPHTKLFFFVGYEGFRLALGVPNLGRVPTLAERAGDFRADPPIFDPKDGSEERGRSHRQRESIFLQLCS